MILRGQPYSPIVKQTLNVRGRAVLGLTANELEEIGYNVDFARADGWRIDDSDSPIIAYVGERHDTQAFIFLKG